MSGLNWDRARGERLVRDRGADYAGADLASQAAARMGAPKTRAERQAAERAAWKRKTAAWRRQDLRELEARVKAMAPNERVAHVNSLRNTVGRLTESSLAFERVWQQTFQPLIGTRPASDLRCQPAGGVVVGEPGSCQAGEMTGASGSGLTGTDLIAFGKDLVAERLGHLGCAVTRAKNPRDGRLLVRTARGRVLEVFVSTQRVGGYAFWTKKRLQPTENRFAALVLIDGRAKPGLYVVPSVEWLKASPPLTDRDYVGKASEPEFGIEIGRSSLTALERYRWRDAGAQEHFG